MWSLLDVVGASAIGGMVILMVITINLQMNSLSSEIVENNLVQSRLTSSAEVFKYDLYKIGYRATGSIISVADSTQIQFLADINNDSNVDTVYYYFVPPIQDTSGAAVNPNGTLYRLLNNGSAQIAGFATNFTLSYYDSLGQMISYQYLSNQSYRNKIRNLKVDMTASSDYQLNYNYQKTDWSSMIIPKNLR